MPERLNGLIGSSVWERLARQAPALVALCLIVLAAGGLNWRIAQENMAFQRGWALQIIEISDKCHDSHAQVALVMAAALDRNSNSLDTLGEHQRDTAVTMGALTALVERMNGHRGPPR